MSHLRFFLALSLEYKGILNIEIKEYGIAEDLSSIVTDEKYSKLNFFITSFLHSEVKLFYEEILYIKEYEYDFIPCKIGYIFYSYPYDMENILSLNFDSSRQALLNAYILLSDKTLPRQHDHHLMQLLIKHSSRIYIYTVNDKDEIAYYQKCGFHVITDNLK